MDNGLLALVVLGTFATVHERAAMPVPETGLGRAIVDRLGRAAAPRA